ncbi:MULTISPECIES: D-2-hydroxyacid dehydrogenase [unclassified Haladaptatus]|uniref:D-2-hydroxyacid dehydrogenase n=1 Tax=unclassified Haladaptatus TaxID=2622732 RepID=UPI00209BC07A|nr:MULTISPECIES: D-2-hydroxyacid dehydrogenase [unclassified Haladaptatus]MCO8244908.1 D-2-hydroxyacid dehydrogenase [Haladaptatus sp. AB643]MCO8255579.1 D-2-hydroxyacid dehydrogenase [Haladaptatus sp. AB618]
MTTSNPDIVVLRGKAHGIPTERYGAALRERLPEYDVRVASTPKSERELVERAPVVTGIGIDEETLAGADEMRYFACGAAGTDHLPKDEFRTRGITVTNAAGTHVPNIAEHVLGNLLLIARRLDHGIRQQDRREWRQYKAFGELRGTTVTVVGLGEIGRSIVKRLDAFDVHTIGVRYTPEKGGPTGEVVGFEPADFHEVLSRTNYLVLACPLTECTRYLIGDAEFRTLPSDAVVVNIARGEVIDTTALVSALRSNKIHAAALDVTDPEPLPESHPLWNLRNVFITPHVSGHTEEYWSRTADVVARNIRRIDERGSYRDLENQVLDPNE